MANKRKRELSEQDKETEALKDAIVAELTERKAIDVVVMDLRDIQKAVADFFVIATGTSNTHLASLTEYVEKHLSDELSVNVWRKEGQDNREWILLDYASVVVHLFKPNTRTHFALEDLWGDAEIRSFKND